MILNYSKNVKNRNINFGPQYPSTDGVFRFILKIHHESIK